MSAPESVNRVVSDPFDVSTLKWISVRLILPIVICGTMAVGLQATVAGGPKLAAADLPKLADLTPDVTTEPAAAALGQFDAPAGPGDARHEAAAAMLLLLVATARSKRVDGEAQRGASAADLPVSRQTADAGQIR